MNHSLKKARSIRKTGKQRKKKKRKEGEKSKGPKEPIESRLTQKEAPDNVFLFSVFCFAFFPWNGLFFFSCHFSGRKTNVLIHEKHEIAEFHHD